MQRLNDQNRSFILSIRSNKTVISDIKCQHIYTILFKEKGRFKDFYDKYNLQNYELKNTIQKTDIPFYGCVYEQYKDYLFKRFPIQDELDNLLWNHTSILNGNRYGYRDYIHNLFSHLVLLKDSQNYNYFKDKEKQVLQKKREEEEKLEKKKAKEREEKIKKQLKKNSKEKEKRESSKKIVETGRYAFPAHYPILSVDDHFYSQQNPKHFLQIAVVYGIAIDSHIVYIGSTQVLSQRIKQHEQCVNDKSIQNFQQKWLYEDMRKNDYQFVILFKGQNVVNLEQLESIQFGYISKYHPKYNYKGVKSNFSWRDKREERNKISWDEWIANKEIVQEEEI